jgi:hypothetical protein
MAFVLTASANAAVISTGLDLNIVRPAMPNEGYLHFVDGGEDLTGWIDTRNPAYYDGPKSTTITKTTDPHGIGYDRSDFQVQVHNVIATIDNRPGNGTGVFTPHPDIERDFNYANQIYRQLGISVLSTGNQDATYQDKTISIQLTDADVPKVLVKNRVSAPIVNNYYVPSIEDAYGGTITPGFSRSGTAIGDAPRNDTFAHETGHFLLDNYRFTNTGDVNVDGHSPSADDLMAGGFRHDPNNSAVKQAPVVNPQFDRLNTAPSQPGQNVGVLGTTSHFEAPVGIPPAGGSDRLCRRPRRSMPYTARNQMEPATSSGPTMVRPLATGPISISLKTISPWNRPRQSRGAMA